MTDTKTKKVKVIEHFSINVPGEGKKQYKAGSVVSLPAEMVDRLNGGVVNTNMNTPIKVLEPRGKKK